MTALVLSLVLSTTGGVSLADRPTRVQLLEEQARLTADVPSLTGGVVRLAVGGGLTVTGGGALALGLAATIGSDVLGALTLVGLIGGVVLIVGVVVAIVGIVHTVRTLAARAERVQRLEAIEEALQQSDPLAPTPIAVLTF